MTTRTLISAEALATQLDEPRLGIFDCRFDLARPGAGREQYDQAHLPRAVYADLNRDLSAAVTARSGRHPLPPPAVVEGRLRAWGMNSDSRIVAYDDGNGMYAARLWWMLRWLGHDDVAVLDGGMRRWRELGLPLEQSVPESTMGNFVARLRPTHAVDATAVMEATGNAAVRILDARAPERFRGEVEPIDAVAGHVPGARNHPYALSLAADGRFLPPEDLRTRLVASLDGVPADRAIAMCGSGVTACHLLLALEHAGLGGGRLYPGSWSEWSSDPARPAGTGESPCASAAESELFPTASAIVRATFFAPGPEPTRVEQTARKPIAGSPWKIEDSLDLYGVNAWGNGYFGINAAGHVVVRPDQTADHEIDLHEVIRGLEARDLTTPVVVRFSDILHHRLKRLHDAFASAIAENDYRNRYSAVFPIKVNQQRLVVEEVYGYGREFGFGLEVGSKPELLAVMAMTEGESERMIVCNGFKDDSYIEAVILATKLGRTIIPVVENFDELGLILKHARAYEVRPRIGVRVKLASEGAGRWRESSGEKSKFGLFVTEILELFRVLREHGMEDCLQLVHCHPGSQLQDIRRVKDAVNELAHVYAELKLMGAGLRYIDVGGGLGVDYDGSRTNYASSMNYTLAEYASDVVYRIASVCNARGIDHPVIVSESGRAIAAHHSLLVFNTLGSSALDRFTVSEQDSREFAGDAEVPQPVRDLRDAYSSVTERRLVECYHDAQQAREQALQMFNLGYLSLEHRGLVERLYWATCAKVRDFCRRLETVPEELQGLEAILSDIYFCNFSVFQSLPDSWAIDQLFPLMPIHRLDEQPVRNAVLADITCDSDGKIDRFVSLRESKRTLELHELRDGEPYYLAAFMVGAYQETLGDLHNLFGDTHVVHIKLHAEGGWWIEETVKGDTAAEVLRYMRYDVDRLLPQLARDCERAVREGRLSLAESQALRRFYDGELNGYTYLEPA